MIKYFYLVKFEYSICDDYNSYFNLGVFSNLKFAKKKIDKSIGLAGFNQYNFDNFKIIKFGVDFDADIKNKSDVILYCVTHEYDNTSNGFTYWNIFDYFSTTEKAKKHIIEATNIENSKDEMKVLDTFLFRCWQMGWLDQYEGETE